MTGGIKKFVASLAVLAAGFFCVAAAPYDPGLSFRSLTKKDGLPQMSVTAIERDSEGFMWFGTRAGLCRYDGVECKIFNDSNSRLRDNYITDLLADPDGNLWIGTTGGFNRLDVSTGRIYDYHVAGSIRSLLRDEDGIIWGCNSNTLFSIDPQTDSLSLLSLDCPPVCLVAFADASRLLAGTERDGLFIIDKASGKMESVSVLPSDVTIQTLLKDRRSNYWVGTRSDGLFRLDRDLNITDHLVTPQINNNYIRALAEDRNGNIIVGSYDGINVLRSAEGDIRSYRLSSGTQTDALTFFSIISLYSDPDGTLWAGSYVGGVNYANPFQEPFLVCESLSSKLDGTIANVGVLACGGNGIWIGMEGDGLMFRNPGGQYERIPVRKEQGYRANIVSSLSISAGMVYAGFNDGVAATVDEASRKTLSVRTIVKDCPVMAICRDEDGTMFYGTWGAGECGDLHILEKVCDTLRSGFLNPENNMPLFNNITSIVPAGDGSVYISERDGGMAKYDYRTGEYKYSNLVESESSHKKACVNALIKTSDGSIFAATHRNGLIRVSPALEETGKWSVEQGLPSKVVHSVVESENGILWVATPDAVSSVDVESGDVRTWSLKIDGEFNRRSAAFSAGNVYMGAGKDMVHLSPARADAACKMIPPHLISVSANGHELSRDELSGQIKFRPLTYLSVYFRSLDYSDDKSVSYSYCIEGIDPQWISLGNNPRVNIANIPAGRYIFRTKAFSGPTDKYGTEGDVLAFRVMAPLWRRWWMLCLYLLLATVLTCGFFSWKKSKNSLDDERAELQRICENLTLNFLEPNVESAEADFMKKVYECINAHIDDPSLGVDLLCAEVGASRTGLYYKIKKISGMSPMDFVKNVRMNVACKLLQSGTFPVADIAEKVGFSSASYFSTAFKNTFGLSPSDYINEYKNKPHLLLTNNKAK